MLPPDPPRVVVVSSSDDESEIVVTALQRGAVCFVKKPTTQASERLLEIGAPLLEAVRGAMGTRVLPSRSISSTVRAPRAPRRRIVVVGASTGGPQALTRLFAAFPSDWIVPIATVLHLPAGYTEAFARRLDEGSALTIREAHDAMILAPGMAVVAKGGIHLELVRGANGVPETRLRADPIDALHRPSVDVLFASAASAFGADVVAVVLTGMGADGREGARAIRDAGGVVLTQSASSCVVYGMPRSVEEAGLSTAVVAMDDMAAAIAERVA
jgi:two-component system chemotaxis response regulator CheB